MPYENEHACRINSPDKYDKFARKNCAQKHNGKCIDVIYGIKKGKSEIQALRYPKKSWTAASARSHCNSRNGSFEAAKKSSSKEEVAHGQLPKEGNVKTRTVFKTMSSSLILDYKNKNNVKVKSIFNDGSYAAVAVVGNQFWNKGRTREFCLAEAVERDYGTMDNTFHNIDHDRGIKSLVGIHKKTEYDADSKTMIIHVYPKESFHGFDTWKDFIDTCKELRKIPNVSIECIVKEEEWEAKELKEFVDIEEFGFKDDDKIWVEVEYRFVGAATVNTGACDDEDGCGFFSQIINDNEDEDGIGSCKVCNDTDTGDKENMVDCDIKINVDTTQVDEAIKKLNKLEKRNMTKEDEETDDNIEEVAVKDRKIEVLQGKLKDCGKLRADLELEIEDLKVRMVALEKTQQDTPDPKPEDKPEETLEKDTLKQEMVDLKNRLKEAEDKLSKPVSRKPTANQTDDERVGIKAIRWFNDNKIRFTTPIKED